MYLQLLSADILGMYSVLTGLLSKFLRDCFPHKSAMQAVDEIDWPEGFVRRDIGWRAMDRMS